MPDPIFHANETWSQRNLEWFPGYTATADIIQLFSLAESSWWVNWISRVKSVECPFNWKYVLQTEDMEFGRHGQLPDRELSVWPMLDTYSVDHYFHHWFLPKPKWGTATLNHYLFNLIRWDIVIGFPNVSNSSPKEQNLINWKQKHTDIPVVTELIICEL